MYLNDWKATGKQGMLDDFGITETDINGAEILLASYTYEDYEGSAFVLFKKDGKLFEVNGGHCSCYGLSESDFSDDTRTQWQPEETTKEALAHRMANDTYFFNGMRDELKKVVDEL